MNEMDQKFTELIMDELRIIKVELKELSQQHTDLKFRVYGISILIGFASGEIKNVINAVLGIK